MVRGRSSSPVRRSENAERVSLVMYDENKITDPTSIAVVLSYCEARPIPCWAVHTPADSTIGGFACRLESIDGDRALIRIANDDTFLVPLSEIHLSAS